jgi:hypothetical protein
VLYILKWSLYRGLCGKCTRALTFENFQQGRKPAGHHAAPS